MIRIWKNNIECKEFYWVFNKVQGDGREFVGTSLFNWEAIIMYIENQTLQDNFMWLTRNMKNADCTKHYHPRWISISFRNTSSYLQYSFGIGIKMTGRINWLEYNHVFQFYHQRLTQLWWEKREKLYHQWIPACVSQYTKVFAL